jgi:hypothetical protein
MPYITADPAGTQETLSGIEDSLTVMTLWLLFDFLCLGVRDLPQLPPLPMLVLPGILGVLPFRSQCIAISGSPVVRHDISLRSLKDHCRVSHARDIGARRPGEELGSYLRPENERREP